MPKTTYCIEATIYASRAGLEALTPLLERCGITHFTVDDPLDLEDILANKDIYAWDYVDEALISDARSKREGELCIMFYLTDDIAGVNILNGVKLALMRLKGDEIDGAFGAGADLGRLYLESRSVDSNSWENEWKRYATVHRLSPRIVVCPSWENFKKTAKDEIIISIDPGMAFGTGGHESTALAARLLEKAFTRLAARSAENPESCAAPSVADVGCGSGILSIIAAKLGGSPIWAVDNDDTAIEVAYENFCRNNVDKNIIIQRGNLLRGFPHTLNIIVANITANLVATLAGEIEGILASDGVLIGSGILSEQKRQIEIALESNGFLIFETLEEGEWYAFMAGIAPPTVQCLVG